MSPEIKTCQNCRTDFLIESADFQFYKKVEVPPPTFCPDCRRQRRLMFRNERTLYRRNCDLCKKTIVSMYPADTTFPVYCNKCWWSDAWDPHIFGQDFDFSKTFNEQFQELQNKVPQIAMMSDDGVASVNCEYANDFAYSKNCYMTFAGWYSENILYSYYTCYDRDVMDCWMVNNSELMYECTLSEKSYGSTFSHHLYDCRSCHFSFNLKNCSDCFLSTGLRGKSYYILNQPYTREKYFEKIKEFKMESRSEIEKLKAQIWTLGLKVPRKAPNMLKCLNSTGNMLLNSKEAKQSFFASDIENSSYIFLVDGVKNSLDINNSGKPDLCYESVTPDHSYGNISTVFCWQCNRAEYSQHCHSSTNVFGCLALKKASYSIFNKKFSKEEYVTQRERIVNHMKETGEWGEFFSPETSLFAYNEAQCQEWFPLTKPEVLSKGYKWKDPEIKNHGVTVAPQNIPNTLSTTGENVLQEIYGCAHNGECNHKCATAFKVIPQELQFYQKFNLPIPNLCFNCRHYERLNKIDPVMLTKKFCDCSGKSSKNGQWQNSIQAHFHGDSQCPNEIETVYAENRPETVYCEQCYTTELS